MINRNQLQKIKRFAVDLDWNSAFGGKSKGNRHLFRIVKKALELGKGMKIDRSIVEAGAWLHDTNLEKTIAGSTLANKEKVIRFLKSINVNEADIKKVLHCIEAHDGRVKARSMEAKLIHDADTLEKSGPLGVIRETWKKSQMGWPTEKIVKHLESHLKKREKKIYTAKAKKIAKENNDKLREFFRVIRKQLNE